jgi:5-methylcytosine-specific restriction endonuclease McrA
VKTENVAGKKQPVKGGGICIYCGWDGGTDGLHDEHVVPYSLGGNTELLKAVARIARP